MTREELKEFLRENLNIRLKEHIGYNGARSVEVELRLDDIVISRDYLDMKDCKCEH